MLMDLEVAGYETYDDLLEYVEGSARVVGLMMLPVLGTAPGVPLAEAAPYAALLGEAFQLTNFVRDVGEDLDRGRLYLPAQDLAAAGLAREDLEALRAQPSGPHARPPRAVVDLLEREIERCHDLYARARPGLALLDPRTRPGVQAATTLYGRDPRPGAARGVPGAAASGARPRAAARGRGRHHDRRGRAGEGRPGLSQKASAWASRRISPRWPARIRSTGVPPSSVACGLKSQRRLSSASYPASPSRVSVPARPGSGSGSASAAGTLSTRGRPRRTARGRRRRAASAPG